MTETTVVTTPEQFHAVAADVPAGTRVSIEIRTGVADPFDAYRRARSERGGAFLETTGGQEGWGYFDVDPVDSLTVSGEAEPRAVDGDAIGHNTTEEEATVER